MALKSVSWHSPWDLQLSEHDAAESPGCDQMESTPGYLEACALPNAVHCLHGNKRHLNAA